MTLKARGFIRPALAGMVVLFGLASVSSALAQQAAQDLRCKGCVGPADLADNAVKAKNLRNNAVGAGKIRNNAVRGKNIRSNSITSDKIADGSITADDIAPGVLDGGQDGSGNGDDSVTSSDIVDGTIIADDIADGAVTSAKIQDGTIDQADLSEGAQPAGAAFSENGNNTSLELTDVTVNSVTLNLPGPGIVVVNVGGYARFGSDPADARCAIRKDSNSIGGEWRVSGSNANANSKRIPNGSTRAFAETGDIVTYNLNCREITGQVSLFDPWMNAIYVPQDYTATPSPGLEQPQSPGLDPAASAGLKRQFDTGYLGEPLGAEDVP